MNSKFYQHFLLSSLALRIITSVWPKKNRCNVLSKHRFASLCISNIYFNLKDKFLLLQHMKMAENIMKCGKYAKIRLKMLKNRLDKDNGARIRLGTILKTA